MDVFSLLVVFTCVWWLVFFMVLPFGARPPERVETGMADGAPERPRLWLKAGITTAIAVVLTVVFVLVANSGWINFRGPV